MAVSAQAPERVSAPQPYTAVTPDPVRHRDTDRQPNTARQSNTDQHGYLLHGPVIRPTAGGPAMSAIAVAAGRVLAVGDVAQLRAEHPDLPEIRLPGGALLPAFVDAHQHAWLVAADPGSLVLAGCREISGLLERVRWHLRGAPPAGWARLHGYEPLALEQRRSPTAGELDAACPIGRCMC